MSISVKVKKLSNTPQLYSYTTYVPNPNAYGGAFAKLCAKSGYGGILGSGFTPTKEKYLLLSSGQLFGKRYDVLNHIAHTLMLPPCGLIHLVPMTGDDSSSSWIADDGEFFLVHNFMEG